MRRKMPRRVEMISSPAGRRDMGRVPIGLGGGGNWQTAVVRFRRGGVGVVGGRVGPDKAMPA